MRTFVDNEVVHQVLTASTTPARSPVDLLATAVLLTARCCDGRLLVEGRTWTGFADAEEQFADDFVGHRVRPFWIERSSRRGTTDFIVDGRFKAHAVPDRNLVTGQRQYSGVAAPRR